MYAYIYDEIAGQGRFDKLLYKIEKRLTDLGLNGKIIRLGISKNIKNAVADEIRQGTKTIVAVGNDATVCRVLNAVAENQSEEKEQLTLGIIPLEESSSRLAASFGIKGISPACEILLARRLETFQLAQINHGFFLYQASIEAPDTTLEIDKNFILQNLKPALIEIINFPHQKNETGAPKESLQLRIRSKEGESLLFFKNLLLLNNSAPITVDGALTVKTPVQIKMSREKIRLIVGKGRIL